MGSRPRWLGSEVFCRKGSDRWFCPSRVLAVRTQRAVGTWFDDAHEASSNHLLLSGKLLRGRAGEVHQGENLQLSLRLGRRAWAQKVCQLVEPAQIACAECAGCARVAGELRSRRATDIYVLTAYAPSGRQACSAEELVRLVSPRACRSQRAKFRSDAARKMVHGQSPPFPVPVGSPPCNMKPARQHARTRGCVSAFARADAGPLREGCRRAERRPRAMLDPAIARRARAGTCYAAGAAPLMFRWKTVLS